MKTYNFKNPPLKVFGVPFFEHTGEVRRLPDELCQKINTPSLGERCPGARVCFRTDASCFTVRVTLASSRLDVGMAIFAAQSAAVLIGDRKAPRYAGLVDPKDYETLCVEKAFYKSREMEDVTVFLPRNEPIANVEIIVDEAANVEDPTPYINVKPIVYYGSSITEGGCCTMPINAYNAIISNRLNVDYYNLGFSNSARGELEIADYINKLDMSIFVYDYDYNAPTAEHLEKTHEPFFKRIREKHPEVPVVILTRPSAEYKPGDARKAIIKRTYDNAVAEGDKNVYFVDGETYFKKENAYMCLVDTVHPNDFGFMCMANTIQPVIEEILAEMK